MARQRYSLKESLHRLLLLFRDGGTINEQPEVIPETRLSEDEALSDIAELFNNSLPNQTLVLPTALSSAITTAGFASGTAISTELVTGTSTILVGVQTFVFGSGLSVSVSGTTAYLDTV